MVTRVLAAGQEDEEIRNAGILYLNEQDVKKKKAFIIEGYNQRCDTHVQKQQTNNKSHQKTYGQNHYEKTGDNAYDTQPSKSKDHQQSSKPSCEFQTGIIL